jgi:4-oxalocrotonate tautomerase
VASEASGSTVAKGGTVPFIEVKLWEGRSRAQKAELARRITEDMVAVVGCPAEAVSIVFDDYAQADWAEGGALCDGQDRA